VPPDFGCQAGSTSGVRGVGLRVYASRFRIWGSGISLQSSGFSVQGVGFRAQGLSIGVGFRA
jgi:hypothetical protein